MASSDATNHSDELFSVSEDELPPSRAKYPTYSQALADIRSQESKMMWLKDRYTIQTSDSCSESEAEHSKQLAGKHVCTKRNPQQLSSPVAGHVASTSVVKEKENHYSTAAKKQCSTSATSAQKSTARDSSIVKPFTVTLRRPLEMRNGEIEHDENQGREDNNQVFQEIKKTNSILVKLFDEVKKTVRRVEALEEKFTSSMSSSSSSASSPVGKVRNRAVRLC